VTTTATNGSAQGQGVPVSGTGAPSRPEGARRARRTAGAAATSPPVTPSAPPQLHVGGPADHSWRETALTRVYELRTLSTLFAGPDAGISPALTQAIGGHLHAAEETAKNRTPWRSRINGSALERTRSNLDAAEADLLRIAPDDYVVGQLPSIQAHVRQHLPRQDPRRAHLEEIATSVRDRTPGEPVPVAPEDRNVVIAAVHGASSEARREGARVRSFRNVLFVTAALMTAAALGLALLGILSPETLPVCFRPEGKVVCPTQAVDVPGSQAPAGTGASADESAVIAAAEKEAVRPWDIPLIQLVGLIAAAVAGAAALRGIRGTSTPYSIPVALALLKLPTGALTALLGLLLMRGQFVPGLSALDFPAQVLAWAIAFGYAQQLFTRLVDQQGQQVLDSVGGPKTQPVET
jgi:hypothetical protein